MFLKTRLLEIKLDPANFEVPRGLQIIIVRIIGVKCTHSNFSEKFYFNDTGFNGKINPTPTVSLIILILI